ncbi:phosphoserine phosphatase SerB [Neptuniibacter caesariensis]|uniref:Phosphoserine phosphatase n=1 Tax=Neptuniibacter caesariensis TaxID=207954 RepID=A0A7U8GRJ7_NEPCE|nr:phosphoserine phosphatase SerB [Neptuniibacter caesariensis]EAR60220.1 Phosphoserine phosphatase SerB:HAD-superfamily hydrolase, subfamily IB (PSPase-like) [Oceanospirillum sp. MED92] [Neptuniibacter caesariensis]
MNEIILLNISGEDKPGVTSAITSILAEYEINILDIGQAVIHNTLSLGILIEVPKAAESSPLLRDILFKAHELNMHIRFQPVEEGDYEQWVTGQGKSRHIITLLSRKLSSGHIARVTDIAASHGLNIDNINRLSGRISLNEKSDQTKACVEFSVRGAPSDAEKLKAEFLKAASDLDVDIAFQKDDIYRRNRRLVVFDMDSTLIEAEVIDELAKEAGVGEQVSEITEAAMRGEIDFNESFRRRMALLKGLDVSVLDSIAERLPMTEGAEELVSNLKALGFKTAILSGGFNYFASHLQKKLGFDYVYANDLDIDENGKVTGEVKGTVVNGERKAELLREIAAKEGVCLEQTIAVGDGANDLPMLSIAGLGIAFRAKPLVRESAEQAISTLGLDGILYLIGFRDRDTLN